VKGRRFDIGSPDAYLQSLIEFRNKTIPDKQGTR
jgi:UTP-glucose-1-phosphate uridylyltransferase